MSTESGISESYGEILTQSLEQLIKQLPLTANDVFVDLGSGVGQTVIHFFLHTPVNKAYGIEINAQLHQKACEALVQSKTNHPHAFKDNRLAHFIEGSFLTHAFDDATVVLINSTCFTQSLLQALAEKIEHTASIHTLLSLRPLPNLSELRFSHTQKVQCSWDSELCYVYRKHLLNEA